MRGTNERLTQYRRRRNLQDLQDLARPGAEQEKKRDFKTSRLQDIKTSRHQDFESAEREQENKKVMSDE